MTGKWWRCRGGLMAISKPYVADFSIPESLVAKIVTIHGNWHHHNMLDILSLNFLLSKITLVIASFTCFLSHPSSYRSLQHTFLSSIISWVLSSHLLYNFDTFLIFIISFIRLFHLQSSYHPKISSPKNYHSYPDPCMP